MLIAINVLLRDINTNNNMPVYFYIDNECKASYFMNQRIVIPNIGDRVLYNNELYDVKNRIFDLDTDSFRLMLAKHNK